MLKKITIAITLIFTVTLFYLSNKYDAVGNFKFAAPKDFVPYYEAAVNQFWLAGIIICFVSWVWVDVVIIKTRQLFWLWLPSLFIVFVAIINSKQEEQLFHFKKANGLWKGGALSYFVAAGLIFISGVILLLNYFGFKKYFQSQNEKMSL